MRSSSMDSRWATVDGNEACARIAYQLSDVIAIYPITPSSSMAEAADAWAAAQRPNLWGSVPSVVELQSEAGAAGTVHGAQDFALVAHAATLEARVPFLHFFDGFRTSHELQKIETIDDDAVRAMIDQRFVDETRARGLSPDRPVLRGSAQNPDVFFQN